MKNLLLLVLVLSVLVAIVGCGSGGSEAGANPTQANRPVSSDPSIPKGEK